MTTKDGGRTPPMDLEAERAVLGAVLIDPGTLNVVLEHVRECDFYREPNRLIFGAMLALAETNRPVDEITVLEALKASGSLERAGGMSYLAELDRACAATVHAEAYARSVREKSQRRAMIYAAQMTVDSGYDETVPTADFVDQAQRGMFEATDTKQGGAVPIRTAVREHSEAVLARYNNRGQGVTGLTTGFAGIDELTLGLQPTDLIILAARPAMGKTTLATNMAMNAAHTGASTLLWSLEMGIPQLMDRIAASEARIDHTRMRTGMLGDGEWQRYASACERMASLKLHFEETPAVTIMDVRARAQRLKLGGGLDLLVVDYLQLMRGRVSKGANREQEISEISRGLKALAKELKIPVIALSQLNRGLESRADKRPMLSDLRESGAIEQDADIVVFLYRDEVYHPDSDDKGMAEVIVAKNRNGATGTAKLKFMNTLSRFENPYKEQGY